MEVGVGAGLEKEEKLELFHHSVDLANLLRLGSDTTFSFSVPLIW